MFATRGFDVLGVDVDAERLASLAERRFTSPERALNRLVDDALAGGHLRLASRPEPADAFIIAVPTPLLAADEPVPAGSPWGAPERAIAVAHAQRAELRYLAAAAESIVPHLRPGNLVVLESTVPPGTTRGLLLPALERSGLCAGRDVPSDGQRPTLFVAYCPERVLPGNVVGEIQANDRLVGGVDRASAERARDLYATFVTGGIALVDAATAEMVKLMENAYRDVNVALANEFALLAEEQEVDVWEAIDLANRHPRVNILRPGPGVGGHCVAVDPWFLIQDTARPGGVIAAARRLNDGMAGHVLEMVERALDGVREPVVAALGIAYKAHVDDARESPAVAVVEALERRGYIVRAHDPYVTPTPGQGPRLWPLEEALAGADCVLVLTDHRDYQGLDLDRLASLPRHRVVCDTRGCLDLDAWAARGFHTYRLGSRAR
jgi:UDP-N-acetyl-D-mannosaminuronic acid dehydrogenase